MIIAKREKERIRERHTERLKDSKRKTIKLSKEKKGSSMNDVTALGGRR